MQAVVSETYLKFNIFEELSTFTVKVEQYSGNLRMKAVGASKILVIIYHITWHLFPEDNSLNILCS
jgi:hypothetical protein